MSSSTILDDARARQRCKRLASPPPAPSPNGDGHADDDAAPPLPETCAWPGPLAEEAYHGLPGDIIRAIEPHTEADPVAILVQSLVTFGNMVGRTAHFKAEGDFHYANEFGVLMGKTAKGRKGTSWGRVRGLIESADEHWANECIQSGLSSGEGLMHAVRDKLMGRTPIKRRGSIEGYEDVEVDAGVNDKRLMIYEPEFAVVLKMVERQGNTLSAIMRQAWESGNMRSLTKNNPTKATGAYVSLIGHCTTEELRRYLSQTEMASGFGNRFLWFCVRRSKCLPDGGCPDAAVLKALQARIAGALAFARTVGEMRRSEEARTLWHKVYPSLSEGKPGLAGALVARGEAHVMRLAMLYALMDYSAEIQAPHLLAALALWDYVEQSVRYVFGESLGDPLADDILRLLRGSPRGLSRTTISEYLGRHVPADKIGRALGLLVEFKLARREEEKTKGRPAEWWFPAQR